MKHLGWFGVLCALLAATECATAAAGRDPHAGQGGLEHRVGDREVSRSLFVPPAQPKPDEVLRAGGEDTKEDVARLGDGCLGCNITRTHVIERAKRWIQSAQPYSTCGSDACGYCAFCDANSDHPRYRCDCSGYVSYSWRLRTGYVTSTLPEVAHRIEHHEMKPGDVYLNDAVEGHVILFNGWSNDDKTKFYAMQEPGCHAPGFPPHATASIETLPIWGEEGLFKPYRYNHITD